MPEGATLAELLREQVGLTGTKIACEEGTCGACTVLLDGRATLSCILLAVQAEGREVTTIEGLGDEGALSPLQRAFVEEDALQCGFCTAGQVVSATALLAQTPNPTSEQVRDGHERQPLPLRRVSRHRARGAASRRGAGGLMAKLQKTSVEMEGRFEERWVLVEEEPPAWEDEREFSVAGKRVTRMTGPRRVSGAARYVSDVALPGMLQGIVVRSPHAHATVALDLAAARAVPGVHAVLAFADLPRVFAEEPAFAGAPVAALACEDAASARAAVQALAASYEQLGFVVSTEQALSEQRLQEDPVEDESGDVEAGMAEADVIIEAEYATGAQIHHALEPHCAVAQWLGDELHAFVSTQGIWDARQQLAKAFELDPDRVHVTCEFMGGGFGAKQGATTEGLIAAYLSRAAGGRAVRVFNDRRAEAVAAGHRASTEQTYRIGARSDGTLTAIEVTSVIANPMSGWVNPTTIPARTLYLCPNVRAQAIPLKIDVEPSNAFRAPGVMEGTFGYESALDELAAALSLDPLALRRANDVDVDQVSGLPYTAKHLSVCIDRAAELSGWAERDALRDREHPDGRRRGLGAACQIWWGGGGPPAHALVRMGHDGVVTVVTGAQDIGTGVTTAFAQVAAEELGLPLDRVRVEVGSTRYGVYAPVSGGSQTMPSVAPAVRSAAYDLRAKLLELAGDVFEVSPDDLRIVDGDVRLARRRTAGADRRGDRQARQGAAGRHRLARPEPRRHAREHVRLPGRAGRRRRRDR